MDAVIQMASGSKYLEWDPRGNYPYKCNGHLECPKAAEETGVNRVIVTSSDSVIGYTVLSGSMIAP